MTTEKADIAYHLNLTESARRRPDLEEGDVIAFMGNAKTGQTEIEKLSQENSGRAVMAGVISRSAYIYAHAPRHDVEKGRVKTLSISHPTFHLILCPFTDNVINPDLNPFFRDAVVAFKNVCLLKRPVTVTKRMTRSMTRRTIKHPFASKSSTGQKTFYYRMVHIWNNLHYTLTTAKLMSTFKFYLKIND